MTIHPYVEKGSDIIGPSHKIIKVLFCCMPIYGRGLCTMFLYERLTFKKCNK